MKKILFSLLIVGVVSAVAIGATRAYFTDQESVLGNTINTGTIHITGTGDTLVPVTISNLKPGDWYGIDSNHSNLRKWITFVNDGTLPIGHMSVQKVNVVDPGNLNSQVNVSVQCHRSDQTASDNAFFTPDWGTKPTISTWFNNSDILDGPAFYRTAADTINLGLSYTCTMDFSMPTTVGNAYQGLTSTFDLVFTAEQMY